MRKCNPPINAIYRPWKVFVICYLILYLFTKLYFHWDVEMSHGLRIFVGGICVIGGFGAFSLVMRNVIQNWKDDKYYVPLPKYAVLPFEVLMYTLSVLVVSHVLISMTMQDILMVLPVLLVAIIGVLDTLRSRTYNKKRSHHNRHGT